jgi:hypothetical protein
MRAWFEQAGSAMVRETFGLVPWAGGWTADRFYVEKAR